MNTFLSALKARRTCYRIGSGSPIDDSRISGLVKEAISVTPSAFNMQSTRAVLLFGAEHEKAVEDRIGVAARHRASGRLRRN